MTDRDETDAGETRGDDQEADAPTTSATAAEAPDDGLSVELDHLQTEFEALNDRHLRLAAEFQNYRRRAENEMAQSRTRAQAELVRGLLDVLDDLQRVSALDPSDPAVSVQSIVEGVDLVERKFLRTLEDAGVEPLDPEGEAFDPETMEAIMRIHTDDPDQDDHVGQVLQKGYRLDGHLVRPARVGVLKHG